MSSVAIDSLMVNIQTDSQSAGAGINALCRSLEKIKSSLKGDLGFGNIKNQLREVSDSASSLDESGMTKLSKLAMSLEAISKCGTIKLSSTIATQIGAIGTASQQLDTEAIGRLSTLSTALSPLTTLGKSNLNSFISQITRLPMALQGLSATEGAKKQIKSLVKALKPLSEMPKQNISGVLTQLKKIPQIFNDLNEVDMDAFGKKIEELVNDLKPLADEMAQISAGFSRFPSQVQKVTNGIVGTNNRATKSYKGLIAKISAVGFALQRLHTRIGSWIDASNTYIENLNLFRVSMGDYAKEAQKFAEEVGELMGINPADWMRNQGVFMTLATGFGVASDRAATMSQNLTQLGYDISSFYNINVEDAMLKLQSGLAGELEPLRRIGYDLSIARLQQEAYTLGINKSVSAMTQAEKAELRYYAIMTQVTQVQGDMARTLESPANQLRILQAQLEMTAISLGNIFLPIIQKVLPYVIAFTKVIRLVADTIASLFGFEIPKFDTGSAATTFSGIADDVADTNSGLGSATKKAKEFKKVLMGFDELNIISAPDTSVASSGGSGAAGGIRGSLGFELPTYDFIGDAVATRVNEIVDKMKEWLGIDEKIDSWADLFHTRLGKIAIAVGAIGAAFLAWKFAKPFLKGYKTMSAIFGKKGLGNVGDTATTVSVPNPKSVLKALADIALIVGGVVLFVEAIGIVTKIPGFEKTLTQGISALSITFTGIGKVILPIAAASTGIILMSKIKVDSMLGGMKNAALVIAGVPVVITAIGALMSIPGFDDFLTTGVASVSNVFNSLMDILLPITVFTAGLLGVGMFDVDWFLDGMGNMALIIGGTVAVITAIGVLTSIPYFGEFLSTGIESVKAVFNGLYDVALPIGVLAVGLLALGIATPAPILSGFAGFVLIIGGLETVLIALGALNQIPGFSWIIGEGGKVLVQLGGILGDFAGSIIGSALTKISDSFPSIGTNLSGFINNAKPFFDTITGIDESSVNAAKSLAACILELTAAGVIDGLTSWLTGGVSLDKFGAMLPDFGKDIKAYSDNVKGIKGSDVTASANAAKSIAELAKNLPNNGGLLGQIMGENDLASFGKMLPEFGKNLKKYSDNVRGVNADTITASSSAAKSLVELAKEVPNMKGLVSFFTGDNDIKKFGEMLPGFGSNLKKYGDNIAGIKTEVVTASANAAKSIVELSKMIPNSGGLASLFAGDNDIATFGKKLSSFGQSFGSYYNYVKGFSSSTLGTASTAMKNIIDSVIKLKNNGATNTVREFGDALKSGGKNIASFLNNNFSTSKATSLGSSFGKSLGNAIARAIRNASLPTIKGKLSIEGGEAKIKLSAYAAGGFPSRGQLFVAREAGPEMVGSIGRKTAVANNNQIIEGIQSGVAEATNSQTILLSEQNSILRSILAAGQGGQRSMNPNGRGEYTLVVQLDGEVIAKKVFDVNNDIVMQTGSSPLLI